MFDELKKYKAKDHFFLWSTGSLSEVCNAPADKEGVFLVYTLQMGSIDLVYIGSSGKTKDAAGIKDTILNGQQFGAPRKKSWPIKMLSEDIEALDIYWWVTNDGKHTDDPIAIEEVLLKRCVEIYGAVPKWNKKNRNNYT